MKFSAGLVVFILCVPCVAILCGSPSSQAQVIRQLTDHMKDGVGNPHIDDAGSTVFAIYSADPFGTDPDHAGQIVRWTLPGGSASQVGSFYDQPVLHSVSDDGQWLSVIWDGDPLGQNPDRGREAFLVSTDGATFVQLTQTPASEPGEMVAPLVAGSGNRVVFLATTDPLGTNPNHYEQLFIVDADGTDLIQLTDSVTDSQIWGYSISDDGEHIVFSYNGDLIAGGNPELNYEVFKVYVAASRIIQLTTISNAAVHATRCQIAGSGDPIFYIRSDGSSDDDIYMHEWSGGTPTAVVPNIPDYGETLRFSVTDDGAWLYYSTVNVWAKDVTGGGLTQLTFAELPVNHEELAVSGDGSRLAFRMTGGACPGCDNPDGSEELVVMDPDGSNVQQLTDIAFSWTYEHPEITPDGSRVVFLRESSVCATTDCSDYGLDVWYRDTENGVESQVTEGAAASYPSVSADGNTIAFVSDEDLFVVQADGSGLLKLVDTVGGSIDVVNTSIITPDGNTVVYEHRWPFAASSLRKISTSGGDPQVLASLPQQCVPLPRIDGDGEWVVFSCVFDPTGGNPDGSWEIFRIRIDGTGLEQISDSTSHAFRQDISADGNRIVWDGPADPLGTNPELNWEIFFYDDTTGTTRQLTVTASGGNGHARISDDGQYVYFVSSSPFFGPSDDELDFYRITVSTGLIERADGPAGAGFEYDTGDGTVFDHTVDEVGRAVIANPFDPTGGNRDRNVELWQVDFGLQPRFEIGKDAPTLLSWEPDPRWATYDVIRGVVANLAPAPPDEVDLGPVVCIENDSTDVNTRKHEDVDQPGPGEVFFYLYRGSQGPYDGPGSWGQGSGSAERIAGLGECDP